ncbi:MAG: hypothetical protein U9O20_03665 [Patescibacteria group bacterium]|nr:hypothetical protein [Patescibacteria group bacterium]
MNKKILVIACVVMVTTILSGCSLFGEDKEQKITKKDAKTEQEQKNEKGDKNNSKDGNYFETMTDLLARGKSMKCTYTQEVEGEGTSDGIVYMADKNSLVEMTTNADTGRVGKMYALITDEWHYSWVEGSSSGFKMTVEAAEMDEKMKNSVSEMTNEIDFECKKWKKDNSKFEIPSNVNFQDMSEMMEGLEIPSQEEMEADANKAICDACKNVPADLQAECLDGVVCDWQ